MASTLRLWAVTSGWSGPFQHEVVLVAAPDVYEAMERAERAFGDVSQPVCRAKVRARELGGLDEDLLVGPIRAGESIAEAGLDLGRRCAPAPGSDDSQQAPAHAEDVAPATPVPQGR